MNEDSKYSIKEINKKSNKSTERDCLLMDIMRQFHEDYIFIYIYCIFYIIYKLLNSDHKSIIKYQNPKLKILYKFLYKFTITYKNENPKTKIPKKHNKKKQWNNPINKPIMQ